MKSTIKDPVLKGLTKKEKLYIMTLTLSDYLLWYNERRKRLFENPTIGKPATASIADLNMKYLKERVKLFKNREADKQKFLEDFAPVKDLRSKNGVLRFYDVVEVTRVYYLLASPKGELYDVVTDSLVIPRLVNIGRNQDTIRYAAYVRVRLQSEMFDKMYINVDRLIAGAFLDQTMRSRFPMFLPGFTHILTHRNGSLLDNSVENLFYREIDAFRTVAKPRDPFISDLPNAWEAEEVEDESY